MPSPRFPKPCHVYRLLSVSFSATAIVGFFCGKQGFHFFLVAALFAAIGAKDLAFTRALGRAIRMCLWGK
jgi:hypothetical protein